MIALGFLLSDRFHIQHEIGALREENSSLRVQLQQANEIQAQTMYALNSANAHWQVCKEAANELKAGKQALLNQVSVLEEQNRSLEAEKSKAGDGWKENGLIFPSNIGTPFSMTDLQRDFVKILKAANLPRIRFHDLRHTAASLVLNHGIPASVASKMLGHSNPSVTLSIYAHSTLDMQSQAANIMDGIVIPIPVSISKRENVPTRSEK